jgi:uncharacterized protein (TIGR02246 family)
MQPSPADARLEVQRASDQFWAARMRGDATAFASQFTEDGSYMVPGLGDAAGRTEILALAQKRFASATSEIKVERREIEVSGDTAHELAWYSEVVRPKDDGPMRMFGRYLLVWKRGTDNVWRVHRYLYNFSGADPL